jgi:hypothetical protein
MGNDRGWAVGCVGKAWAGHSGDREIWGGLVPGLSLSQKQPTKNGSEHPISQPLFIPFWVQYPAACGGRRGSGLAPRLIPFISTTRFDLFPPYPLTLLLIGVNR